MATASTFSGITAVSSGSLADLIDRCQVFLNDEKDTSWDTEMIGTFLNDAIRDYSQHFPRVRQETINLVVGQNIYDLPADLLGLIAVEYPGGQNPPEYLGRKAFTAASFWWQKGFYDVVYNRDDANVDELWLSTDPSAGQTAVIHYNAAHQLMADPAAPTETNSVPELHQPLLVKYVAWQAALHLASAEQQNPTSNSSLLMAQLAQNARRSELSYHTALQQAIYAREGLSRVMGWRENGGGRIY
jgi:hypothetical protein